MTTSIRPTCSQVLWAMATRSRPAQSIDILRETWSTFLDPSLNPPEIRPWGSKALINACMDYRYIKTFSKRTKLSKPTVRAGRGALERARLFRASRWRYRCSRTARRARASSDHQTAARFGRVLAAAAVAFHVAVDMRRRQRLSTASSSARKPAMASYLEVARERDEARDQRAALAPKA